MPRLPPSLKWLIDRRGRVAGEIAKVEKQLAKCQQVLDAYKGLNKDLATLKKLLKSVDATLTLHEVQIQRELIPTIRSQEADARFPYGLLSRTIFQCFRAAGKRIVSSQEITSFVAKRLEDLGYPHRLPNGDFAIRIKRCLQTLYYNGHLVRHHDPDTHKGHGLWSLVEREFSLSTQSRGGGPGSTP